jgi:hypothetical protein
LRVAAAAQTEAQGSAEAAAATPEAASAGPRAVQPREASLDEYRGNLQALTTIVEACAQGRDAKTCDPALVGPDDRVQLVQAEQTGQGRAAQVAQAGSSDGKGTNSERRTTGRRLVRYGWLRVLLSRAQEKDKAAGESAHKPAEKPAISSAAGQKEKPNEKGLWPAPRTTTEQLQDAQTRLAEDLAETNTTPAAEPAYAQERETMKQVLAGREFRNLDDTPARDSAMEKFVNWVRYWLSRLFGSIAELSSQSPWIGRLILWGFILVVCVGLVWGLIQLERRSRLRLVPEDRSPGPGAASARDWQLWLEDARRAAAAGQWREAIHFIYWASISRLESRRLWPADRARTPREYLALVAAEDPRKAGLAKLTGSFERIWYGGRAAAESDYARAEQLATALIAASGASGSAGSGGAAR